MGKISQAVGASCLLALLAAPAWNGLAAQQGSTGEDGVLTTVYGERLKEGPEIKGVITARRDDQMQVTTADGNAVEIAIDDNTEIRAKGGFLNLSRNRHAADALLNGLPVTIRTWQAGNALVARQIDFRSKDLKTASMIRNATAQRFAEHDAAIEANAAAAEALRGRVADIDKYVIKGTANVYFDSGKWNLSPAAKRELCDVAARADAMDNVLLLVVGYTDSVGSEEYNQVLSERRAGRVINYLQQYCGWKPWRMLTPTGMAEADPLADNSTPEGRAQNRRVSVNILVSKAVEGM